MLINCDLLTSSVSASCLHYVASDFLVILLFQEEAITVSSSYAFILALIDFHLKVAAEMK